MRRSGIRRPPRGGPVPTEVRLPGAAPGMTRTVTRLSVCPPRLAAGPQMSASRDHPAPDARIARY
jgi:hypothetical protein